MKLIHFPLLIILVSSYISTKAQDFILSGVVMEKGSHVRIAFAEVNNLRTRIQMRSNEIGIFQLKANTGDTLLIRKKDLQDQKVLVKDNQDLVIHLTKGSTMLEEVTINGQTKKQQMEDIKRDFKRNGSFFAGKPPLILLSPFGGSPLTFLYELFGKTPANAKRFNRYYTKELNLTTIDKFFNKNVISSYTNLNGKELDQFMLDYYPDSKIVKNWNNYDAVQYIKTSAKKYTDTLGHLKTNTP